MRAHRSLVDRRSSHASTNCAKLYFEQVSDSERELTIRELEKKAWGRVASSHGCGVRVGFFSYEKHSNFNLFFLFSNRINFVFVYLCFCKEKGFCFLLVDGGRLKLKLCIVEFEQGEKITRVLQGWLVARRRLSD